MLNVVGAAYAKNQEGFLTKNSLIGVPKGNIAKIR